MERLRTFLKTLGPGLLFASMAIGTSHLVLSTKAGAQYGWVMIIPIILANLLKYPFFEFGVRYTSITENSLIQGYLNLGKRYLVLYGLITLVSVFTILAALYVVTSGLFINLFQITSININTVAAGLFAFISLLLIVGRYRFLEISLKLVISILFLALIVTTFLVINKGQVPSVVGFEPLHIFNEVGVLFLIGLVGWMPTAVEASGWVSMWSMEKIKSMDRKPTLKESLAEFNLGYFLTALLAVFFLIIGWLTLYGTGTELSGNAVIFADQVVSLFTTHVGDWAYFLIAIAAFATMFSTCMTAHDAVARVSLDVINKLYPKNSSFQKKSSFGVTVILLALINWIVISAFGGNMANLVALATFVSFVMAPLIGWMNLKTVSGKDILKKYHPSKGLQILSFLGMLFLSAFALYYCSIIIF
ncbi:MULTISPECIES: NRAMP family divalent metal transporter [Croceitalea]|uniref:Divalent metal cation transporter n=1 Tax=Croceitalea vernalis TaxID=3075599 RepID=A0ABU3BFV6_9FLAO|nr:MULTISPECIES: divalent metal cation transporter [unclassified Croceitalea]MDT0539252.1 divalent metal cation transporter [Croceitalea sp. P059]MDT0621046.1 divalent metal cation transporter [Croceitalea sp. P007]